MSPMMYLETNEGKCFAFVSKLWNKTQLQTSNICNYSCVCFQPFWLVSGGTPWWECFSFVAMCCWHCSVHEQMRKRTATKLSYSTKNIIHAMVTRFSVVGKVAHNVGFKPGCYWWWRHRFSRKQVQCNSIKLRSTLQVLWWVLLQKISDLDNTRRYRNMT